MRRAAVMLALCPLALAACAVKPPVVADAKPIPIIDIPPPKEWDGIARPTDQALIAGLPQRWSRALAMVPRRSVAALRREGALVQPEAALEAPTPPPGPYHCRLVRFGGRGGVTTYKPDFCYVEARDGRLAFTKQTGTNRPRGWLYEDTDKRRILLGTTGQGSYGDAPSQDVSGVFERVSSFRWRLTLTRAGRGASLDVYELVPVTPEVPGAPRAVPAADG